MDAVRKKSFWIVLIAIVLIIIAGQLIAPKEWKSSDADLVVTNRSDTPIGSIVVDYPRWDGSSATEGTINADGSMITTGQKVYFFQVTWPAIVSVYADSHAEQLLMQFTIDEAPGDHCRWEAAVCGSGQDLSYALESVPKN